jgi:hypothetical protein
VAGRFPLLTDEHVPGPLIKALLRLGWHIVRAIDIFGQRSDDAILFAYAAEQGRVFVTNDEPAEAIAVRWAREGRAFRGLVCWKQQRMSTAELVEAFEELATREPPFPPGYPVVHLKPKR